ncbi:MAG: indole-3-glycerol phosphate synthase TrpC [Actinobacteria bacterium]|nr:indole-3-glycerol phosphate synthase TrpC [Actinomycetota bacterium]
MDHLTRLLASTRARVEESKIKVPVEGLEQRLASVDRPRGFGDALRGGGISLIAEIKRATPSRGVLNLGLDAGDLAASYSLGGAAALSVLTEPDEFRGSLDDLAATRAVGLPTLRKDFIIDDYQVLESRAADADAILLIVRALEDEALSSLLKAAEVLGLDAVVEVHDAPELDRALQAGASIIAVNHRDLTTFRIDPDRTAKLAPGVPDDALLISLSGVESRDDVEYLESAGADAVLVGESLVLAHDPAEKVRELLGRA